MNVLQDILVPKSLLKDWHSFGGADHSDCLRGDLVIQDGRAAGLFEAKPTNTPRMLVPALTEAHCHLDKCHSLDRIGSVGGNLATAIAAQKKDKEHWTVADLRSRMIRGLDELEAAGCQFIRSHIDWGDTTRPPLAWGVLQELAQDRDQLTVQTAALTGADQVADRDFCFDVAKQISLSGTGVFGVFVLHHERIAEGLSNAFAAAEQYGLALDFHVDEGLGAFNGLEAIADTAVATGFQGPILCGHAVSLMDREADDLARILDKLARTNISVCALPTTNLYLQDRRAGTPDRRGLTRLRELRAANVPIVAASDNVADAFCPMGQHDPRAALHLASLSAHLDPPMGDWLPAITTHATAALGLEPQFLDAAPVDRLYLSDSASTADLIAGRTPLIPLLSLPEASAP